MKVQTTITLLFAVLVSLLFSFNSNAQQYKLRQVTAVSGMKSESTIYVKGSRKRTEGGGYMGMGANLVTIEQCDLQRTIRINDKKKLYYIDPFSKEMDETDESDVKPATKTKTVTPPPTDSKTRKGGVIYMYYNITDTGERKKMYGVTARHVWSTQKIKPSADACMMKDSMVIKTDGWYIDLPQFNCPVSYGGRSMSNKNGGKPDCMDRFVSKRSGKGKLGFPLIETKTMIMGNGSAQTSEFVTSLETLEFSTVKLDSMLFEIPLGYQETKNEEDLQEPFNANAYIKEASKNQGNYSARPVNPDSPKKAGAIRIAVAAPSGDASLQANVLQGRMVELLTGNKIEAVAVSSEQEAKKYNCDYILTTEFTRVKQGGKVGSILKAIKNTDPTATSSYTIDATMTLTATGTGSTKAQEKVSGKFDGKSDEAALKAMEKGWGSLSEAVGN